MWHWYTEECGAWYTEECGAWYTEECGTWYCTTCITTFRLIYVPQTVHVAHLTTRNASITTYDTNNTSFMVLYRLFKRVTYVLLQYIFVVCHLPLLIHS